MATPELSLHIIPAEESRQEATSSRRPLLHDISATGPGTGLLGRRVDRGPLSWKDGGFLGGASLGTYDAKGHKRTPTIDTGETATIISVSDLGLSSVPRPDANRPLALLKPPAGKAVKSVQEFIRDEIEKNLAWSAKDDEQEYLPIDAFEKIFTAECIESFIRERFPALTDAEFQSKIIQIVSDRPGQGRRRILGALIFMKKSEYIDDFIREGISDDDLPLKRVRGLPREFITQTRTSETTNTKLLRQWDRVDVDSFYRYQNYFFVPFFKINPGSLHSYMLAKDTRLPWQEYEHKTSGGIGIVHRLQIHKSHHDFKGSQGPDKPLYFAVKEMESSDRETYRKELKALERDCAQLQKEKHLIRLLLTFQQGDRHYLVFEWADGNLLEFWQRPKVEHKSYTKWVAQECLGIANAIKRIHGLSTWQKLERSSSSSIHLGDRGAEWGRHGDIKPNNILWFSSHGEDRDLLVVSDLGLTRYHSLHTKSLVSTLDGYTGTYRAPEVDLGQLISPRYDIWCLGCLFLEFCIWHLEGYHAIVTFGDERYAQSRTNTTNYTEDTYFILTRGADGGTVAQVNPAVGTRIRALRASDSCQPFTRGMLDLIENRMLVVDKTCRSRIDKVCREISDLAQSLENEVVCEDKPVQGEQMKSEENEATRRTNPLVQHAEGNSKSAYLGNSNIPARPRAISLGTTDGGFSDETSQNQNTPGSTDFDEDLDTNAERPASGTAIEDAPSFGARL
ncbi:hypothetical protein AK830_g8764 [Neonectria ditissima]|uniref:Protein kinase domain-containing protein n=1 Tax=Neonectria ditissima TaxID=78410 RepID=A0A0P7B790_9HYPO|nr:hypothetical protein AK830_g8764 [Neonectria ditissima]